MLTLILAGRDENPLDNHKMQAASKAMTHAASKAMMHAASKSEYAIATPFDFH